MAKRIDRDLGQEIFIDEMKRAEAKGNLPPATVTPQRFPVVRDGTFNPGMEVVQDPSGMGKTPNQVAKDLASQQQKSRDASYEVYENPSFLSRGLQNLGLLHENMNVSGDASKPRLVKTKNFKGLKLDGVPLSDAEKMLMAVGNRELRFQDPQKQREAIRLYDQLKKSPAFYDYYGRNTQEEMDRLESEFPSSTDQQLMENMRKR